MPETTQEQRLESLWDIHDQVKELPARSEWLHTKPGENPLAARRAYVQMKPLVDRLMSGYRELVAASPDVREQRENPYTKSYGVRVIQLQKDAERAIHRAEAKANGGDFDHATGFLDNALNFIHTGLDDAIWTGPPYMMESSKAANDKKPTKENTRVFAGLPVVVEWDEGDIRKGKTEEGKEWERIMAAPYGYILGTKGAGDKEGVDVYLGADENAPNVYVIEQLKDDGSFDEYKVMLGFDTMDEARDLYLKHYPKSWKDERLGEVAEFPLAEFKQAVAANQDPKEVKKVFKKSARRYYHGSDAELAPGTILKPGNMGWTSDYPAVNAFLEKTRPQGKLPRDKSVFMTSSFAAATWWGRFVYEVQPIGKVEKNDYAWFEDLIAAQETGELLYSQNIAGYYWSGEPHSDLWEYRAPEAKVIREVTKKSAAMVACPECGGTKWNKARDGFGTPICAGCGYVDDGFKLHHKTSDDVGDEVSEEFFHSQPNAFDITQASAEHSHTREEGERIVEALRKAFPKFDIKLVGSVASQGFSDNDYDILITGEGLDDEDADRLISTFDDLGFESNGIAHHEDYGESWVFNKNETRQWVDVWFDEASNKEASALVPSELTTEEKQIFGALTAALSAEDRRLIETLGGGWVEDEAEIGDYDIALIGTDLIPDFWQVGMQRHGFSMADPQQQMETQPMPETVQPGWRQTIKGIREVLDRWLADKGRLYLASHNPVKTAMYTKLLRAMGFHVGIEDKEILGHQMQVPYIQKTAAAKRADDDESKERSKAREDLSDRMSDVSKGKSIKDDDDTDESIEEAKEIADKQIGKESSAKPKCPECGSTEFGLMPADFETAKCSKCGKTWEIGIVPGINDPKTAAKKLSPTQVSMLTNMQSGTPIFRLPGGFWTWEQPVGKDNYGSPVWKSEEEGGPRPWVDIRSIRALENLGLLRRVNKYPEEWRDERIITPKGVEALKSGKVAKAAAVAGADGNLDRLLDLHDDIYNDLHGEFRVSDSRAERTLDDLEHLYTALGAYVAQTDRAPQYKSAREYIDKAQHLLYDPNSPTEYALSWMDGALTNLHSVLFALGHGTHEPGPETFSEVSSKLGHWLLSVNDEPYGEVQAADEGTKTVCAWCSKVLKEGGEPASHGICEECKKKNFPETTKKSHWLLVADSKSLKSVGWLTPDGEFHPLVAGESHRQGATRIGISTTGDDMTEAFQMGAVRVVGNRWSDFEFESLNPKTLALIRDFILKTRRGAEKVAFDWFKPKRDHIEFYDVEEALEWLENPRAVVASAKTADSPQLTPHRYEEFEQSTNGYALQPDRQKPDSAAGGTNVNEGGAGIDLPQLEDMAKKQDLNELEMVDGDKTLGVLRHGPPHATEKIGAKSVYGPVYHGAAPGRPFGREIRNDKYTVGRFFSSNREVAKAYGPDVYECYLVMKKPFIVDADGNGYFNVPTPKEMLNWVAGVRLQESVDTDLIAEWAHKKGYDGVIIKNVIEPKKPVLADDYIIFDQNQLKSAKLIGADEMNKYWIDTKASHKVASKEVEGGWIAPNGKVFAVSYPMEEHRHHGELALDFGLVTPVSEEKERMDVSEDLENAAIRDGYIRFMRWNDGAAFFECKALDYDTRDAIASYLRDFVGAIGSAVVHVRSTRKHLEFESIEDAVEWLETAGGMVASKEAYRKYTPGIPAGEEDVPGTVYLIHTEKPFHHLRHYLGWTQDLNARLEAHRTGRGANVMRVLKEQGINWELARTWPNVTRKFERRLKNQGGLSRHCPICAQEGLICPSRARTKALEVPEGTDYVETCVPEKTAAQRDPVGDRVVEFLLENGPQPASVITLAIGFHLEQAQPILDRLVTEDRIKVISYEITLDKERVPVYAAQQELFGEHLGSKFSSWLLILAAKYDDMFKAFLNTFPLQNGAIQGEIAWAKANLKKNDRIVWYLRWVRLVYENAEANFTGREDMESLPPEEQAAARKKEEQLRATAQNMLKKDLEAYNKNGKYVINQADVEQLNLRRLKSNLEGWYELEAPEIEEIQFGYEKPDQISEALSQAEDVYTERIAEEKRYLPEPSQEGDEPFIKFGDGWVWWFLNRAYCSEEARAMGHCGNEPRKESGDRILSLREPKKRGGKNTWVPHLTFIIDKNGMIGEAKGRGNDKPAEKYYPYIISLLKDRRVHGLKGATWFKEHNFKFDDLTEKQQKDVIEANPYIGNPGLWWKEQGTGDIGQIEMIAERLSIDVDQYKPEWQAFLLREWETVQDMVHAIGGGDADEVVDWVFMDESERRQYREKQKDTADLSDTEEVAKDIVKNCEPETVKKMLEVFRAETPRLVTDFLAEWNYKTKTVMGPHHREIAFEDLDDIGVEALFVYAEQIEGMDGTSVWHNIKEAYEQAQVDDRLSYLESDLEEELRHGMYERENEKMTEIRWGNNDGPFSWKVSPVYEIITLEHAEELANPENDHSERVRNLSDGGDLSVYVSDESYDESEREREDAFATLDRMYKRYRAPQSESQMGLFESPSQRLDREDKAVEANAKEWTTSTDYQLGDVVHVERGGPILICVVPGRSNVNRDQIAEIPYDAEPGNHQRDGSVIWRVAPQHGIAELVRVLKRTGDEADAVNAAAEYEQEINEGRSEEPEPEFEMVR